MKVPGKLDVQKGGTLLARHLNVAATAWNSNESGLPSLGKKVFLLKTSARRFTFPLRWLSLKGMRFCSPQRSTKPDSQEIATLQLLRCLQIWTWTKLIQISLLRIPWTSKDSTYSPELRSIYKNSTIFSVTFATQVSSSWLLPSCDQSTLRQSWSNWER